jgi:hypothetical protein
VGGSWTVVGLLWGVDLRLRVLIASFEGLMESCGSLIEGV